MLIYTRSDTNFEYTAGKSTLLQLLSGKRLISTAGAELKVKGCDVFRDFPSGVTFLGTEWSVAY